MIWAVLKGLHFQWSFLWNIHQQMALVSSAALWNDQKNLLLVEHLVQKVLFFPAVWPFPVFFTINAANAQVSLELQWKEMSVASYSWFDTLKDIYEKGRNKGEKTQFNGKVGTWRGASYLHVIAAQPHWYFFMFCFACTSSGMWLMRCILLQDISNHLILF